MRVTKRTSRIQRHRRNRAHISGTRTRPRLSVFRSRKYIYAQLIDDTTGHTLVAAREDATADASRMDRARAVGAAIAQSAVKNKIKRAVFDRGGYRYHGRVKALAEAARENGLQI